VRVFIQRCHSLGRAQILESDDLLSNSRQLQGLRNSKSIINKCLKYNNESMFLRLFLLIKLIKPCFYNVFSFDAFYCKVYFFAKFIVFLKETPVSVYIRMCACLLKCLNMCSIQLLSLLRSACVNRQESFLSLLPENTAAACCHCH